MRCLALAACAVVLAAGCGGGEADVDPVTAAQRQVTEAESELKDARADLDDADTAFCDDSKDYVEGLDRYGRAFRDESVTVGDITTAGADLEMPRAAVTASAQEFADAHERVQRAEHDLAEAEAKLAETTSGTTAPATTTTTTQPVVPAATVDRVERAEKDLTAAFKGVDDDTPLTEAAEQVNAAAFALEVAWLRLFADAGCLTSEQEAKAVDAVAGYTTALQSSLKTAGYLDGEVDGAYGPATVAAVEQLQTDKGLPVTGYVDRATAEALDKAVAAAGGESEAQAVAHTAALQSTLALAGYWSGPIDGQWSDALTAALKKLQTDLGVPATGVVDAATLAAAQDAIASAKAATTTTTAGEATEEATTTTTR